LGIVRRRRWALLIPGSLGVLLALLVTFTYPRLYIARTMFERRDSVVIANLISAYQRNPASFTNLRKSLYVDIKGYKPVERAVEQLGLDKHLPRDANGELTAEGRRAKQAMVGEISSDCQVYLQDQTDTMDIITMILPSKDPARAKALLTALRENYIQSTQERITDLLTNAQEYFRNQADRLREQVSLKESEMVKFRARFVGSDPADPESIVHRLTALTIKKEDLSRRIGELETEIRLNEEILGAHAKPPSTDKVTTTQPKLVSVRVEQPATRPNPEYAEQHKRVQLLLAEIAEKKATMTDEHPVVRRLNLRLRQAEQELARIPPTIPLEAPSALSPAVAGADPEEQARKQDRIRLDLAQRNLQQQLAKTKHELGVVEQQIAQLEAEKGTVFERRREYLARQEDLHAAINAFKQETSRYNSITEILNAEKNKRGVTFTVLEETNTSPKPVSPTMSRLLTVSLGFGTAIALACAMLLELLDRSFRSAGQVGSILQLPVLQSIGEIVTPAIRRRRMFKRVVLHATVTVLIGLTTMTGGLVYLSLEKPQWFEGFKANPGAVVRQIIGNGPKVVLENHRAA